MESLYGRVADLVAGETLVEDDDIRVRIPGGSRGQCLIVAERGRGYAGRGRGEERAARHSPQRIGRVADMGERSPVHGVDPNKAATAVVASS